MKKWWGMVLGLITAASLTAEFLSHHHGHWWDRIPGFYIIFGFLGCVGLIIAAKILGKKFLFRDEDYYDK